LHLPFYLGVDAGGSKTNALVVDGQGIILGVGKSGNGNHQLNRDEADSNIRQAVFQALSSAGLETCHISYAYFGLAGADREADYQILRPMIQRIGFPRYHIACDTMIALRAGTNNSFGVVLICGTGTNCAGRNPEGKELQIGGFGYMYGDKGGGGDLAIKAFGTVIRTWEGRAQETSLTGKMLALFNYPDVETMFHDFLDQNASRVPLSIVPELFKAANEGDQVCIDILLKQGEELGKTAQAMIRRLGMQKLSFDVVLAGSVVVKGTGSFLFAPIEAAVLAVAPLAQVKRLQMEPDVGAVMSAMDSDYYAIPTVATERLNELAAV
jgi:N-acetylglucosamine kinase-like BadF-type ATPase